MQNAALQRGGGGLGAVAGLQLGEEVADVKFYGDFGDAQGAAVSGSERSFCTTGGS
jgi:hypothetical protein